MKTHNHTPGPWRFTTSPQPNGCPIIGSGGLMVAMLSHSVNEKGQKETALANAHLIAAAPDLLEALENTLQQCLLWQGEPHEHSCEIHSMIVSQARAAITKAKGVQP